jgi:beta-galactosidase
MPTNLTRRKFLALTAATTASGVTRHSILYAAPTPPTPPSAGVSSLAGQWRFALDRDNIGIAETWFAKDLPATTRITLPGILQTQGFGDDITAETKFIAALPRDMAWYKLPQYAAYTKPGHVEVPYLSQPVKHYLGGAWYQRDITIPVAWVKKRVGLTLERTRWQTTCYVDDKEIGSCRSLVAPHDYDLGILAPGKHRLTIRIDNSMLKPDYRFDGHAVSDAEGSTWNGIVGRIELAATTPVWIEDAQVFPSVAGKSAHIKIRIGNLTTTPGSGTLSVGATTTPVTWTADPITDAAIDVPLPNATPWSEFTPTLQHLTLKLTGPSADSNDHRTVTFGLREIKSEGKHILLNGELFSFRATHDGGGFPLTGYPAMDVATWKHILGICKNWGLNGMRFHSWCPPEAAFTAADELGFYFQPECGMWNSFDAEGKMLAVLNDETARLLKAYGNHPSLTFLNATNEPAGNYSAQLPGWDKQWHDADPRRLYGDGTGRPAGPPIVRPTAPGAAAPTAPANPRPPFVYTAGFNVTGGRGPGGWFGGDYEQSLQRLPIPAFGHEVGQWCSYPDFGIIAKFGKTTFTPQTLSFANAPVTVKMPYMVPGNYEIMRDTAQAHGLLARNKEFAYASGRFQVACYKEEIEASLRTPSYSGYELLDLHDYLGQGGALIGVLDAFWESKGYVAPPEFRQYNSPTVPLTRFKERVYTTDQTFTTDVELSHFGPKPLPSTTPTWRIVNTAGKAVASGTLPALDIPRGKNIALGKITADLSSFHAPAQYKLLINLQGTSFHNSWNFWLYPAKVDDAVPAGILVTTSWDEAKASLATGGKVLFLPDTTNDSKELALSNVPIFWNRLMNPGRTWMLGLWCDTKHPALAGFPTESNCDWQWTDLLARTHALKIDALPHTLQPIVQAIDDWNRNFRLAMLYECSVGPGKLMVSSLDLNSTHPGAISLRRSVLDHMASPGFKPATAVTEAEMNKWLEVRNVVDEGFKKVESPVSQDLVDPGQIRRPQ